MKAVCLVCAAELCGAFEGISAWDQPGEAVVFTGHGAYGSTVFDPFDKRVRLTVVVCDTCLTSARDQGRVMRTTTAHHVTTEHEKWTRP